MRQAAVRRCAIGSASTRLVAVPPSAVLLEEHFLPLCEAFDPVMKIEPPSLSSGSAFCTVNSVPRAFSPKAARRPRPFPPDRVEQAVQIVQVGRIALHAGHVPADQYSPLITKKEPRITPASFDFWRANLKRDASSPGTSMPSESLNPTARFSPSLMPYITLTDRPDS
jgi:hypothetical protein